ncbi:MAG: acyltransferase family protein [Flavobacteriaceae bacterium]
MRRHDLDWLRVFVFALLILYHVGMFFVPWGWHIKNNEISDKLIFPMMFVNQWRLPILFVISGMGTFYALRKRSGKQFLSERVIRLYIPLAVGMLLIVPPQVYIERIANAQFSGGYFNFWPTHAFTGIYPEGNMSWHHLWFLPYLLLFSLLLAPVFLYLKKRPANFWTGRMKMLLLKPSGIFVLILPLFLAEALVEPFFPVTHALIGDWFAILYFLLFFFYGFLLISAQKEFWQNVEDHRKKYLFCGIIGFTLWLALIMVFEDSTYRHFTEAFLKVFNTWSWILTLFGYASKYLNRPSFILSYANEAVYPFYILHQTITIIIAYFIMDLPWHMFSKFILLTAGTFIVSWLIYEFGIRRWKIIRPLFGLKLHSRLIRKFPADS